MDKIIIKKDSKILFIGDSISDPKFNFRMMKDIKSAGGNGAGDRTGGTGADRLVGAGMGVDRPGDPGSAELGGRYCPVAGTADPAAAEAVRRRCEAADFGAVAADRAVLPSPAPCAGQGAVLPGAEGEIQSPCFGGAGAGTVRLLYRRLEAAAAQAQFLPAAL